MLFNTDMKIDSGTCMIHNISSSTSCLLLLLLLFLISSTLGIIVNINAHSSSISPSNTILIETSIVSAIIPSMIITTGINRCRTVVTTLAIPVVVIIITITMIANNTTLIIITSTGLLLLLLLCVLF